jgi:hypothetical protein
MPSLILYYVNQEYYLENAGMNKNRFSKEMLILMAKEFYGNKLNRELLSKAMDLLKTWVQDIDKIESEMLEDDEPIKVYFKCCDEDEVKQA